MNELNAEIPQDTWEETDFGPREPWSHQFAVYLCDADDGSIYTHINSTAGAAMATRELKSRVKWKRSLFGGRKLLPVVTLGSQIVSQKYKKQVRTSLSLIGAISDPSCRRYRPRRCWKSTPTRSSRLVSRSRLRKCRSQGR